MKKIILDMIANIQVVALNAKTMNYVNVFYLIGGLGVKECIYAQVAI